MDNMHMAATVVGLVAMLRSVAPKIDGLKVPLLALALGVAMVAIYSPDTPATVAAMIAQAKHGMQVGAEAVGVMFGLKYAAEKAGSGFAAMSVRATSLAPPPGPGAALANVDALRHAPLALDLPADSPLPSTVRESEQPPGGGPPVIKGP